VTKDAMSTSNRKRKPNVVLILNDDMGYSDLGCYGGEIETPNLDRLAAHGLRFSSFYNTARCSPSRASLLTGLHPHQTGIGILTYDSGPEGYAGNLNHRCVTIPQVLKANGYRTYMSGKWHVASNLKTPTDSWPMQRGFDEFFGTIIGAGSFYDPNTLTRGNENVEHEARQPGWFYTDAISDQAVAYIDAHCRDHASTRGTRSSCTSPTLPPTGRCTRTTKTSRSTGAASTRAGMRCARSASTSSSLPAFSTRCGS